MWKKVTLGVLGATVVGLGIAWVFRAELGMMVMASRIAPEKSFEDIAAPAAPDYADEGSWAALPAKEDLADVMPGAADRETPLLANVFFVHPTTFFGRDTWNQPIFDRRANYVINERTLKLQASAFNVCCDIYAPKYRQATFYSFMDQSGSGAGALDLAYDDVARAFDYFIRHYNGDRPFIIAGHSQGTHHAERLIREKITGSPLMDQLVVGYLIGFSVTKDAVADMSMPICDSATATGCIVGWNTIDGDDGELFPGDLVCVNPLTWEADGGYAPHELNLGGIGFSGFGAAPSETPEPEMVVEPGAADARCDEGQLRVAELRTESFPDRMMGASMHVYDYSLFYMNIRDNAVVRAKAFVTAATD